MPEMMPEKLLKVCVVGTGMIANAAHLPAWKHIPEDVEVVGVADIRPEAAEQTAKRYNVPHAYSDWQKMLKDLKPDIVSVSTPNMYHKEVTIGALKSGAHVLCEKPISTSYQNAVEMFKTADAAGRTLFVNQSLRFASSVMAVKEIVASGKLGEIYYAETSSLRRRGVPKWGMFHMKQHNAGGPVYDLGVHMIDSLMWIMGNPRAVAVSAMTYTKIANRDEGLHESLADSGAPIGVFTPRPYSYKEFDVEDFAAGFVRFENNITLSIKTSWAANIPEGIGQTFILGTEAGIQLWPVKVISNMGKFQVDVTPKVLPDRDVAFSGHWEEVEHIIRVLRGQEEQIVKREQVFNVMRILDGFYKSAQVGREVVLED
jgi:predicted dehydrogenase